MSFLLSVRNSGKLLKSLTSQIYSIGSVSLESTLSGDTVPGNNDMPVQIDNPFVKEKQQCILCKMNIKPDYKNTKLLTQFISPYTGRIYGRHITRLCKQKQEQVEKEITKARKAAFMPHMNKEPVFLKDPKLFNPEKPIRNHDFC